MNKTKNKMRNKKRKEGRITKAKSRLRLRIRTVKWIIIWWIKSNEQEDEKRIMRINKKMKEKANSIQKTWKLQTSIVRWTDRKVIIIRCLQISRRNTIIRKQIVEIRHIPTIRIIKLNRKLHKNLITMSSEEIKGLNNNHTIFKDIPTYTSLLILIAKDKIK